MSTTGCPTRCATTSPPSSCATASSSCPTAPASASPWTSKSSRGTRCSVPELAVVTGAAGGLGSAIAARLTADGYEVRGVDRADGDLTTEAGVAAALAGLETVRVLVHCAGVTAGAPAHETTLSDWHTVLDTNLTSAFLCARAVLPGMMAAGR